MQTLLMSDPKRILYRGALMIDGWPKKIRAAQGVLCYMLNGKTYSRIRYGDERDDWGSDKNPCHDCKVVKGELHVPSCDVEECPVCHEQLLSCDCLFDERKNGVLEDPANR